MTTAVWHDWSCTVRVVIADPDALEPAVADVRALMADVEPCREQVQDRLRAVLVQPARGADDTGLGALRRAGEHGHRGGRDHRRSGGPDRRGAPGRTRVRHRHSNGHARSPDVAHARADARPAASVDGRCGLIRNLGLVGIPRGLGLDLGATAKAWTADRAARDLHRRYGARVLVEIGGDLAVEGADQHPFVVKVAEREGGPGTLVDLRHGGLATSTTTIRCWQGEDRLRHHIIDPSSGLPASGLWRTATVWAANAVSANAAATAAIVMNDRSIGWLQDHAPVARLVDVDGFVRQLDGWPAEEAAA